MRCRAHFTSTSMSGRRLYIFWLRIHSALTRRARPMDRRRRHEYCVFAQSLSIPLRVPSIVPAASLLCCHGTVLASMRVCCVPAR